MSQGLVHKLVVPFKISHISQLYKICIPLLNKLVDTLLCHLNNLAPTTYITAYALQFTGAAAAQASPYAWEVYTHLNDRFIVIGVYSDNNRQQLFNCISSQLFLK